MSETEIKVIASIAELVRNADAEQKKLIEVWCDGVSTGIALASSGK